MAPQCMVGMPFHLFGCHCLPACYSICCLLDVVALKHLIVAGFVPPGGLADVSALVVDSFLYTMRSIGDLDSLANPHRAASYLC